MSALNNLSLALHQVGKFEEAERLLREGREVIVTVQKQGSRYVGERNSLITKCPSKYKAAPAGEKQNY